MRSLTLALVLTSLAGCAEAESTNEPFQDVAVAPATIVVTSADFSAGQALSLGHSYSGFGCVGSNRSPALAWEAVAGAGAYAVTMFDPDAPGEGWWHWTVTNLPATTTSLPAGAGGRRGSLPDVAIQGQNDFGAVGYGGPCPPPGRAHRYVITVYALKAPIVSVDASTAGTGFKAAIEAEAIARGTLTGQFGR